MSGGGVVPIHVTIYVCFLLKASCAQKQFISHP